MSLQKTWLHFRNTCFPVNQRSLSAPSSDLVGVLVKRVCIEGHTNSQIFHTSSFPFDGYWCYKLLRNSRSNVINFDMKFIFFSSLAQTNARIEEKSKYFFRFYDFSPLRGSLKWSCRCFFNFLQSLAFCWQASVWEFRREKNLKLSEKKKTYVNELIQDQQTNIGPA